MLLTIFFVSESFLQSFHFFYLLWVQLWRPFPLFNHAFSFFMLESLLLNQDFIRFFDLLRLQTWGRKIACTTLAEHRLRSTTKDLLKIFSVAQSSIQNCLAYLVPREWLRTLWVGWDWSSNIWFYNKFCN